MKSFLKIGALVVFALLLTNELTIAQERGMGNGLSPNASVSQTIFNKTDISVTYGRPGLKGRDLSSLAPADKVWRTGANEATTITFSTDVSFGGEDVPAGTYTLFTIPGENWTVILSTALTRGDGTGRPAWGSYSYDEANDQVRVQAAVTNTEAPMMERFAIYFDALSDTKTHLNLHWGTTQVAVPITVE
ncbi:MAG: DUF2911 domain-containing protein [Balneola sp.]|nr:MAG: DUF2911 domain-containing protein [Balneola sp.]